MTVILTKKSFTPDRDGVSMPYREVRDTIEIETADVNACLEKLMAENINLAEITMFCRP
jgi:hypothetical protein